MDSVEWSRCMANIFFAHGDPQGELQKFRHFIPPFVLRTFCNSSDQNVWVVYDQNQMYNLNFNLFSFYKFLACVFVLNKPSFFWPTALRALASPRR